MGENTDLEVVPVRAAISDALWTTLGMSATKLLELSRGSSAAGDKEKEWMTSRFGPGPPGGNFFRALEPSRREPL
ncbi:MAG: hypothetical protein U0R24_02145 [Solirubrobacterales bacterium]